mmetsp:Transcript_1988/g.4220  ORF Transcript_1988/g.4220 Transcript_1988/m.4220 type:complete len:80 (+) Transcript_1988:555-794(+)
MDISMKVEMREGTLISAASFERVRTKNELDLKVGMLIQQSQPPEALACSTRSPHTAAVGDGTAAQESKESRATAKGMYS